MRLGSAECRTEVDVYDSRFSCSYLMSCRKHDDKHTPPNDVKVSVAETVACTGTCVLSDV